MRDEAHLRTESHLRDLFETMSPEEQEWALAALESRDRGDDSIMRSIVAPDYKWEPPSIRQFFEDDYYAGKKGRTVYPLIRDEVEEIFIKDQSEVILTGSIGWGKSYAASFGLAYDFLWLTCLANAQEYCGIAPGTDIVMMNLSVTGTQAHDGLYKYVRDILQSMPVFRDRFPYDFDHPKWAPNFRNENILFKCGGSTEFGAIGSNVIGGALDEANFMIGVRKSKRARMAGELDQAKVLYDQIARRRKSRFILPGGRVPCRFWLVSSVQFPGDFLEQRTEAARLNDSVAVLHHNQWTPRMSDPVRGKSFSGKFFVVFTGNAANRSHIVAEDSNDVDFDSIEIPPGCHLDRVPVELRPEFTEDLHGAIRDVIGWPTLAINPLFEDPSILKDCYTDPDLGDIPRAHPFEQLSTCIIDPSEIRFELIPRTRETIQDHFGKPTSSYRTVPTLNSRAPRYVHVDLSETSDATGVAIGHCAGHKDVLTSMKLPDGDGGEELVKLVERRPIIIIDVMMKFTAPIGGRIDISAVRPMILALSKMCGYRYKLITYDQYQSAESIMAFNQMGITSEKYSVDREDGPYLALRSAIKQRRFSCYNYEPLLQDIGSLQHDVAKKKVDHTPGGTKDVSDCVAAVVAHVERFHPRVTLPLAASKGHIQTFFAQRKEDEHKFIGVMSDINQVQKSTQQRTTERLHELGLDEDDEENWDVWKDDD